MYLKVMHRLHLFFFFFSRCRIADVFADVHGHSCPSIMIICIQPQSRAGEVAGMVLHVLFIYLGLFIY